VSLTFFALGTFMSAATALAELPATAAIAAPLPALTQTERFANRPQARISFAREVRNFQVKREDNDDILYLETARNRWYRSEISCFGISDPRDAQGLLPIDRGFGIDSFSRILLVGFSHDRNECTLRSLVELTPQEALDLRLVRPPKAAKVKAATP
jgi:hypothetical protein